MAKILSVAGATKGLEIFDRTVKSYRYNVMTAFKSSEVRHHLYQIAYLYFLLILPQIYPWANNLSVLNVGED